MKLNEQQMETINDFIIKYNSEEEFSKGIQELYNNEPGKLSILQIYTLEEVLRYGTKGIYNKFLEIKGSNTEEKAIILFDQFINLLANDANFKQYKIEQFQTASETLSEMEIFALKLLNISKKEKESEQVHEESTEELEYDPLNPILFSTDKQIKDTLENLYFGEFIHRMLEMPAGKPIRDRQKEKGRLANSDKEIIIKKIQEAIPPEYYTDQIAPIINKRFLNVKWNLIMSYGEEAFKEYAKFNTNISANEILGIEKDNSYEEMYEYLNKVLKKRRAANENFSEEDAMDFINRATKRR